MAKRKVTNYPEEFKKSSAKLTVDSKQPLNVTAEELGVNPSTLHGWVQKYYPESASLHNNKANNNSALDELKQLRKENNRLKQERDILKKAAYFASETM